ncbi:putative UV-B-induced protein [Helianthus anomalus]
METATAIQSPFGTCIRPSITTGSGRYHNRSIAFATVLNKVFQGFPSFSYPRVGLRSVSFQSQKKRSVIRASSSFDSTGPSAPIAPLQLESPIGQFLSQILISHPHLVPAAVDQQLEQLQTDRDAEKQNEEPSAASTDLVLYK